MNIENIALTDLKLDPSNSRSHDDKNIRSIARSLEEFGQQKPIVIDANNVVIAGNGTVEAARGLGWSSIEAVRSELVGDHATAFAIADNRTAELAAWNEERLSEALEALREADIDHLTAGFTEEEIDALLSSPLEADPEVNEEEETDLSTAAAEAAQEALTNPGDIWVMGDHRLVCGDSTDAETISRLMDGSTADLCFTSPPYLNQRDYTEESTDGLQDWQALMMGVFSNLPMSDQGQVIVNLGLVHKGEVVPYWDPWIEWMQSEGWKRFGWYVWDQVHGLPGDWNGRFAPTFEFLFHFNRESVRPNHCVPKMEDNIRDRTGDATMRLGNETSRAATSGTASLNTHKIPDSIVRVPRQPMIETGEYHPAIFPVDLPKRFLEAWDGDVFEPFAGSGSTIIASEALGRRCFAVEISPKYCDIIVKRWEKFTNKTAERVVD